MAVMEAQKFISATVYTSFGNNPIKVPNFTHYCPVVIFVAFVPQIQAI